MRDECICEGIYMDMGARGQLRGQLWATTWRLGVEQ